MNKYRKIIKISLILFIALISFIMGFIKSSNIDYPIHVCENQDIVVMSESNISNTNDKKLNDNTMKEESLCLSRIIQCIDSNSDNDKRTYGLCAVIRALKYNLSIEEVVNKSGQWVGYNSDMNIVVTQNNYDIAYELIQIMYSGIVPVSTEFEYAEWSPSKVTLKNDFENPTETWWWGKE